MTNSTHIGSDGLPDECGLLHLSVPIASALCTIGVDKGLVQLSQEDAVTFRCCDVTPPMSAAKQAKRSPVVDATAGAIAGCAARFVVGPLDVIKIRFQVQLEPIAKRAAGLDPTSLASKYTGLRQALTTIVKEEGVQVLGHDSC